MLILIQSIIKAYFFPFWSLKEFERVISKLFGLSIQNHYFSLESCISHQDMSFLPFTNDLPNLFFYSAIQSCYWSTFQLIFSWRGGDNKHWNILLPLPCHSQPWSGLSVTCSPGTVHIQVKAFISSLIK